MKLLVAGSRSVKEFDLSPHIPPDVDLLISGGAKGIDTIAEQYADEHNIPKLIIRPEYSRYGRGAPIVRNKQMVEAADTVLAIWDGRSKGTLSTLRYAQKLSKKVIIINV